MNYRFSIDTERRLIAAKKICYYNNQQTDYTSKYIKTLFKNNDAPKWMITSPMTERLINDISLMFVNQPLITINGYKAQQDKLNLLLTLSNFYSMLVTVNRMVNLVDKVGVLTRLHNDKLIFDIITPDACFVNTLPEYPTIITELYYYIGKPANLEYNTYGTNLLKYRKITDTTISTVLIDLSGKIKRLYDLIVNPYGYIPVIWFYKQYLTDSFWTMQLNPIVTYNEYYNAARSYLNLALAYQAVSTLVGIGVDTNTIPFGPQNYFNIPMSMLNNINNIQPDIKYINPQTNFEALYKNIQLMELQMCNYCGISYQAYKKQSQYASGYAMLIAMSLLFQNMQLEQPFYRTSIQLLIRCICDTVNLFSSTTALPLNALVDVNFGELKAKPNILLQLQIWDNLLSKDIITLKDILKLINPDLTDKQAIKIIELNKISNGNLQSTLSVDDNTLQE